MNIVLLIFAIAYAVVTVASIGFVIKHFKRYRFAVLAVVTVVLLLIPLLLAAGSYFLGKGLYEGLCRDTAGLRVYREIESANSLYVEDDKPFSYLKYGYKYVESNEDGKYVKYFIDRNTSKNCLDFDHVFLEPYQCIAHVAIDFPASRYGVSSEERWEIVTHMLHVRKSPVVYERESEEIVAALVGFRWDQGWMASITGQSVQECLKSPQGKQYEELMSIAVDPDR